jgi:hypothetical protein
MKVLGQMAPLVLHANNSDMPFGSVLRFLGDLEGSKITQTCFLGSVLSCLK